MVPEDGQAQISPHEGRPGKGAKINASQRVLLVHRGVVGIEIDHIVVVAVWVFAGQSMDIDAAL